MPRINTNFETVPDHVEPIPDGVYELVITQVPKIEKTRDEKGIKMVVDFEVHSDGPSKGRKLNDHISQAKGGFGETRTKQLLLSAGVPIRPDGFDTEELIGKIVRASVNSRTYKDNASGEDRTTNNIKEYLFTPAA